eukprot:403360436
MCCNEQQPRYTEAQAMEIEFYNVVYEEEECVLLQIKNITQILNSEKEKIQAHYQEMLIATISHEVMNPLNSIINLSQIAETQYKSLNDTNSQQRTILMLNWLDFFNIINSSSKVIFYLVKSCLDIQLIKNQKFNQKLTKNKPFDIIQNVYNIFKIQIDQKALHFNVVKDEQIRLSKLGDWDRYQQILINIIQNSVKFTFKGSITVQISITFDSDKNEQTITTSIKDTGLGMSEEVLSNLFSTFNNKQTYDRSSLGKNGIGVGLSICHDLIKALNGDLKIKSELNVGTEVIFSLKNCGQQNTQSFENLDFNKVNSNSPAKVPISQHNRINSQVYLQIQKQQSDEKKSKSNINFHFDCQEQNISVNNQSRLQLIRQHISPQQFCESITYLDEEQSQVTSRKRKLEDYIDLKDINLLLTQNNTYDNYRKQSSSNKVQSPQSHQQIQFISNRNMTNPIMGDNQQRQVNNPQQIINIYNPYMKLVQQKQQQEQQNEILNRQSKQKNKKEKSRKFSNIQKLQQSQNQQYYNDLEESKKSNRDRRQSVMSDQSILGQISERNRTPNFNDDKRMDFDTRYQFLKIDQQKKNSMGLSKRQNIQESNYKISQPLALNNSSLDNVEHSNDFTNRLNQLVSVQQLHKSTFGINFESMKIKRQPEVEVSNIYDNIIMEKNSGRFQVISNCINQEESKQEVDSILEIEYPHMVNLSQQIQKSNYQLDQKNSHKTQNFQINADLEGCQCQNRILIVDDNIFNLIPLEIIMRDQLGLIVDKANNGLEAVEMFKSNVLSKECCNQNYKLILMDLNMPVMDGYEATKQIIQEHKDSLIYQSNTLQEDEQNAYLDQLSIVACTAFVNDENINYCYEVGMKEVLNKPVNQNVLRKVVKKYLNR